VLPKLISPVKPGVASDDVFNSECNGVDVNDVYIAVERDVDLYLRKSS
jgi:hypothetical protein